MISMATCVAAVLGLIELPMPPVVVIDEASFRQRFGRLNSAFQPMSMEIIIKNNHTSQLIAHEYAHYLQLRHGKVEMNPEGYPLFNGEHEVKARKAAVICG